MGFLKRVAIFLIIILILALLSIYWEKLNEKLTGKAISSLEYPPEYATIKKAIDGDTIETDAGKIRFLGINTPEKGKPYYEEAKNYLKSFENKSVTLIRDKEDLDRYSRKLRYVYYNDRFLNIEIIEQGLATTFMTDDLKEKEKFMEAEKFAINNRINLWKKSTDICSTCIVLVKLDSIDDYFLINNNCDYDCDLTGWIAKDDANHFTNISSLKSSETKEYKSKIEIWNDEHDRFFLRDKKGDLVIYFEY